MTDKLNETSVKLMKWEKTDSENLYLYFQRNPNRGHSITCESEAVFTDFGYLEIRLKGVEKSYDFLWLDEYIDDPYVFIIEESKNAISFYEGEHAGGYDWMESYGPIQFKSKEVKYIDLPVEEWKEKYTEVILMWAKMYETVGNEWYNLFFQIYRDAVRGKIKGILPNPIKQENLNFYESSLKEKINAINPSKELYQYLESLRNNAKKVYIIQGRDQKNSSRWYSEIYNRLGLDVNIVHYSDLSSCIEKMNDSWVICELALDEIETIDASILEKLIALNIINDVRAVFISHDKRFFAVMGDSEFQKNALEPDEIEDFNEFYIPTYIYSEKNQELWEDAKLNKDEWIIKHRALGKSKKIFAGSVTPEEEWKDLWKDDDMENMVLQKWVSQGKIRSSLKGKAYEDYATGTLLFINDQHFGYGEFRTSSFPVINKTDHRKMSSVVVSDELFQLFNKNHICIS